jgi:hypothetical protein
MEKEFLPYQQALALKELGFDEPCFGQFYKHPTQKEEEFRLFHDCVWEDRTTSYWRTNISNHFVSAPTFSQAFRWFREKYNLHTEIRSYTAKYFTIIIQELKDIVRYLEYGGIDLKFDTYEEAELACLDKLIELVEGRES